ncbi:plasma membrane protein pth11-like protein [Alternaria alternata]|nr:plasma membrane protein pth11-like protein [Alternaria alternata]
MGWNVSKFIALAVTLTLLATVSVALRIWAHTRSKNKFGLDDVLIAPALVSDQRHLFEGVAADELAVVRYRHGGHHDCR